MIELKCSLEVDTGSDYVSKVYSRKFDTEVISREDLDEFFTRAKLEFIDEEEL